MATISLTRQWGMAWVFLAAAIALHVADEAFTGFLPFCNEMVAAIREPYPWVPLPRFSFSAWISGLVTGVLLLLGLSPLARKPTAGPTRGSRFTRQQPSG